MRNESIVFINIRPYMMVDAVKSPLTQEELDIRKSKRYYLPALSDPLAPLSGPPEGGDAARRTGMVARNNTLMEVTQSIPTKAQANDKSPAVRPEITIATFRGNQTASLNWTLPQSQRDGIRQAAKKSFGSDDPDEKQMIEKLEAAIKDYLPRRTK